MNELPHKKCYYKKILKVSLTHNNGYPGILGKGECYYGSAIKKGIVWKGMSYPWLNWVTAVTALKVNKEPLNCYVEGFLSWGGIVLLVLTAVSP